MRVSTDSRVVAVEPGGTAEIHVDVVNTGAIIDGVTARLIGLDDATVRASPALLPLFPDAQGRIVLTVELPVTFQAGRHPLVIEVLSHTTNLLAHADVDLEVAARPAVQLTSTPRMVRARRTGRFVLEVHNAGNIPLEVDLAAPPSEPGVALRLNPPTLRVEPGTTSPVMATLKGPRMLTGTELDRSLTVELVARRLQSGPVDETDGAEAPAELTGGTVIQLRQRPVVSRGLVTALILVAIVGLWAAVFVFGLDRVFKADQVPKAAAKSYYEVAAQDGRLNSAAGVPTTFLKKSAVVAPDIGGSVSGVVRAASDGRPVGRVLVQAFRVGGTKPVGSAATQADGTYLLTGLFPTAYELKFSAEGYRPAWLSGAGGDGASPSDRTPLSLEPAVTTAAGDTVLTGKSGSLRGTINPGDGVTPPPTTEVTVRLLTNEGGRRFGASQKTSTGSYSFTNLVTPGTYQISFVTPGYGATSVVEELDGGEDRMRPDVLLGAAGGQISGTVEDGAGVLGGATVTTAVAGRTVSVQTPTVGDVGRFTLENLPTPGTYVVTISAPGHGSKSVPVTLEAGASAQRTFSLTTGTTSISGTVYGLQHAALGGVRVTLGGVGSADGSSPTTTTITEGTAVGSFSLNDLPPGDYTLTFEHPGYAPQTQPVRLDDTTAVAGLKFQLKEDVGSITGKVTDLSGNLLPQATITASDGALHVSVVNGDPGGELSDGGYLIAGLQPGWYSVTASLDTYKQRTGLVEVKAGGSVSLDLELRKEG